MIVFGDALDDRVGLWTWPFLLGLIVALAFMRYRVFTFRERSTVAAEPSAAASALAAPARVAARYRDADRAASRVHAAERAATRGAAASAAVAGRQAGRSHSRSSFLSMIFFRKPVPTFRDHA